MTLNFNTTDLWYPFNFILLWLHKPEQTVDLDGAELVMFRDQNNYNEWIELQTT